MKTKNQNSCEYSFYGFKSGLRIATKNAKTLEEVCRKSSQDQKLKNINSHSHSSLHEMLRFKQILRLHKYYLRRILYYSCQINFISRS